MRLLLQGSTLGSCLKVLEGIFWGDLSLSNINFIEAQRRNS